MDQSFDSRLNELSPDQQAQAQFFPDTMLPKKKTKEVVEKSKMNAIAADGKAHGRRRGMDAVWNKLDF